MTELLRVLKTLSAYLVRPHLYPELGRKFYKNIFNRKSALKGKEEAQKWCKERAVSEEEAITEVLGLRNYIKIGEKFPSELKFAAESEINCPVKMGGAGALDLIYNINEYLQSTSAVETGVAYGWSSLAVLLSLRERSGTLYSSDMPYLGKENGQFVGCVVLPDMKKNWKLFRFADRESLPKIFKERDIIDFAHYDSDKSYNGRIWAYPVLYKHLRNGGILMSDDIGDNSAFMDYCVQNNFKPTVVKFDGKFAGFVVKN